MQSALIILSITAELHNISIWPPRYIGCSAWQHWTAVSSTVVTLSHITQLTT